MRRRLRIFSRSGLVKISTLIAACAIISTSIPQSSVAQGTEGALRGRITDAETDELLADVNVVLNDPAGHPTGLGSSTNNQGEYIILNIPPGTYQLQVRMMGYRPVEVRKLVIRTGISTMRHFQLQPTILDVGYVLTVTAEDDPIKRDVTSTRNSYTAAEMERMAVYSTTDILSLQTNMYTHTAFQDDIPGYRDRGLEMVYVRGGRNAEVAFMIDGMQGLPTWCLGGRRHG